MEAPGRHRSFPRAPPYAAEGRRVWEASKWQRGQDQQGRRQRYLERASTWGLSRSILRVQVPWAYGSKFKYLEGIRTEYLLCTRAMCR